MRTVIVIALAFLLAGCVRTRTVTEYVYVPERIEVPVFQPDTSALAFYRDVIAAVENDVNAFDTLTVDTQTTREIAAQVEGEKLRSFRQHVLQFFREMLAR